MGTITFMQSESIENLLTFANITPLIDRDIRLHMDDLSENEAEDVIDGLRANQIDKVDSGGNYSQKDIINKLKRMGL